MSVYEQRFSDLRAAYMRDARLATFRVRCVAACVVATGMLTVVLVVRWWFA